MDKNEMEGMILQMFQKEERIWELMASKDNKAAGRHLERVREAHGLFVNIMGGISCGLHGNGPKEIARPLLNVRAGRVWKSQP